MIAFSVLAAVLAAVALGLALRPLWRRRPGAGAALSRRELNVAVYRDQLREMRAEREAGRLSEADYERSRRELEARLLEDVEAEPAAAPQGTRARKGPMIALAAIIPVAAAAVYLVVGTPAALAPLPQPGAHGITPAQIDEMVSRLAARMREHPEDPEGWKLLGRSYSALGRFDDAAAAYAQAEARAPRDAGLLADYADALAMAQGQSLDGKPAALVARALAIDPRNLKALALAGTAAFEHKDYAGAASYWERMLPLVPSGSQEAEAIRTNIAQARSRAGEPQAAAASPSAASPSVKLTGEVALAPALKAKASPDDTVFIYARAAEGPPMPLAVLRKRVRDLPVSFTLDDAMAMAPSLKLSAFPKVVVTARVSKSGSAIPQSGDLQGTSGPVANDASGVTVTIDKVR